jgi:hypothetical protein
MNLKKWSKKNYVILFLIFILFAFVYFYYALEGKLEKLEKMEKMEKMEKLEKLEKLEEGLKDMYIDTNLSSDFANSFCESNQLSGPDLNKSCSNLTQDNCRSTSCCIWTSNKKCQAGGKDGLLFNKDLDGKKIDLDYYYYKDTCYGKNCK